MSEEFLATFVQVPKEKNEQADCLAKATFAEHTGVIDQVLSIVQYSTAIDKKEVQVIPLGTN